MPENETLADLIRSETSKRNTGLIAALLIQKAELIPEIMELYFRDEPGVGWRAAWAVDMADEAKPGIVRNHFGAIIRKLPGFTSDGTKRSSLRMLSRHPIDVKTMGELMSVCFEWLTSRKESVSVKVFSMEILYSISRIEPDLKKELADSIEWRIAEETPGFRSHGAKMLKKLNKEMNPRKV
jgi:hypothetical protein